MMIREDGQPKSLTSLYVLLILAFFFSLVPFASAVLNDAVLYYSHENFPSASITDNSGLGANANITGLGVPDTYSKVGTWAAYYDTTTYSRGATDRGIKPNGRLYSNYTYSFWVYLPSNPDYSLLFSDMTNVTGPLTAQNSVIEAYADTDANSLIVTTSQIGTGYNSYRTANNTLNASGWTHVVVFLRSYSLVPRVFINTYNTSVTLFDTAGGPFVPEAQNVLHTGVKLGDFNEVTTDGGTQQPVYMDDFGIWNRTLTPAEIDTLYGSGYGFNPYSTAYPTQIASISGITLGTNSQITIDYADFFSNEENISVNFIYNSAQYYADQYQTTINTPDFSLIFNSDTQITWYSLATQVAQTPINISACNVNGCTNVTTSFTVSGFGTPTQIASIADWEITVGNTESRTFSDYFGGYTTAFYQYTDPDGASLINVSVGFPHSNSCFYAQVIGDTLQVTGNNSAGCSVTTRMIVSNGAVSATSNDFTTIINPVSTAQGGQIINYFDQFLTVFPNADDISNTMKTLIVFIFLLVIIGSAIALVSQGASASAAGVGVVVMTIFAILFFTAIGYIPIWLVIVVGLITVMVLVGVMRAGLFGRG